jgi:hypothetical protein
MNQLNWTSIKQVLSDKSTLGLNLLFVFMVFYTVITGGDHRKIKLFLIAAGLLLVVLVIKKITQPLLWYIFLTILISDLICDYFVRANHHFLLIYVTVLIILFLHNSRLDDFVANIKLLLVIVLLFSGSQKLFSPQFISGDFYYYMVNTGSFFKPILYFNQEMNDIVLANKAQIAELSKSNPNALNTVTLQNIVPNLDDISRVYAWFSICMEIVTGLLLLWKPKHLLTHVLFILLIMGIFFTRLESGFMALLAISGIWLTDNYKIRAIYTVLTIVMLSLIITRIGFY